MLTAENLITYLLLEKRCQDTEGNYGEIKKINVNENGTMILVKLDDFSDMKVFNFDELFIISESDKILLNVIDE